MLLGVAVVVVTVHIAAAAVAAAFFAVIMLLQPLLLRELLRGALTPPELTPRRLHALLLTVTTVYAPFTAHGSGAHRAKPQQPSRQFSFAHALFTSNRFYNHVRPWLTIDYHRNKKSAATR